MTYDYTSEAGDEALSATQLKWKQKYRREQKRCSKLEDQLIEVQLELADYKKVIKQLCDLEGIREKITSLIDPKE